MPNTSDIHGTVFKNGSATLMARVVDNDGHRIEFRLTPTSGQPILVRFRVHAN